MDRLLLATDDNERPEFTELGPGTYVALVLIGVLVGGIGGAAGIGGAPFMVASLKLFVLFCQREAQGTVLAVMLPPMSAMGVYVMRDRARVLVRICIPAFLCYMVFSYFGAVFAYMFDSDSLSIAFGCFLISLSLRYAYQFYQRYEMLKQEKKEGEIQPVSFKELSVELGVVNTSNGESKSEDVSSEDAAEPVHKETKEERLEREKHEEEDMNPTGPTIIAGAPMLFNYRNVVVVGALVGVVGGLFGVGAGVLMVPIFTDVMGLHKDDARTLSLMILLPPVSLGAVLKYESEGAIDWIMACVLLALYFFSNYYGAIWGRKISSANFKSFMGMVLGLLGIVIIIFAAVGNPLDDNEDRCDDA